MQTCASLVCLIYSDRSIDPWENIYVAQRVYDIFQDARGQIHYKIKGTIVGCPVLKYLGDGNFLIL